jgi:cell wall-associated NlpC family hydrolase
MADPGVIQNIRKAARATGADPAALLATSLVETGARPGIVGDQGTSFGPFQFHQGGALGTHNRQWADSYAAYLNRAQEFKRLGVHGGAGAAAVQRPADPTGYASKVQADLGEARRLLGSTAPPSQPTLAPQAHQVNVGGGQDLIGNGLLQSLINANAENAGISSIKIPVATPIAPRATPAPVHVDASAQGTGQVDAKGASIVEVARRYLGTKYLWGGASPKTGFDCSGLLQWAAAQSGIRIPRTTYQQVKAGRPVAPSQIQPGDAVFFGNPNAPHHVGVAIGGGKFIEAPHTGAVVRISSLAGRRDFAGARRFA